MTTAWCLQYQVEFRRISFKTVKIPCITTLGFALGLSSSFYCCWGKAWPAWFFASTVYFLELTKKTPKCHKGVVFDLPIRNLFMLLTTVCQEWYSSDSLNFFLVEQLACCALSIFFPNFPNCVNWMWKGIMSIAKSIVNVSFCAAAEKSVEKTMCED